MNNSKYYNKKGEEIQVDEKDYEKYYIGRLENTDFHMLVKKKKKSFFDKYFYLILFIVFTIAFFIKN